MSSGHRSPQNSSKGSTGFLCCFAPEDNEPRSPPPEANGDAATAANNGEAWPQAAAKQQQAVAPSQDVVLEQQADLPAGHNLPTLLQPRPLAPGEHSIQLAGGSPSSSVLTPDHVSALASVVPPLERLREWSLSYSTKVHGTSLATLFRKMRGGQVPTLLLVRDHGGHVFGCYTPEAWRIAPRYYGTGETFVFQLEPARAAWPWQSLCSEKNDYFQYSTPYCLALGGCGRYAIHLDQDLLHGSSGVCGTFGSPCLAVKEEFKVVLVEVWQAC